MMYGGKMPYLGGQRFMYFTRDTFFTVHFNFFIGYLVAQKLSINTFFLLKNDKKGHIPYQIHKVEDDELALRQVFRRKNGAPSLHYPNGVHIFLINCPQFFHLVKIR